MNDKIKISYLDCIFRCCQVFSNKNYFYTIQTLINKKIPCSVDNLSYKMNNAVLLLLYNKKYITYNDISVERQYIIKQSELKKQLLREYIGLVGEYVIWFII